MKYLTIGLLATLVALTGCKQVNQEQINQDYSQQGRAGYVQIQPEESRISITRIDVIVDKIAYGDRRGVYVIIDNKTGKEYIGVSGVGITESGAHTVSSGKTTSTREHEQ